MESICCCAATENGTVDVQKKDFVMGGALRNIVYGSLITATSLLPNFAANAQGPNPGGGDKITHTEAVAITKASDEAADRTRNTDSIGFVVILGTNDTHRTDANIVNLMEAKILKGIKVPHFIVIDRALNEHAGENAHAGSYVTLFDKGLPYYNDGLSLSKLAKDEELNKEINSRGYLNQYKRDPEVVIGMNIDD